MTRSQLGREAAESADREVFMFFVGSLAEEKKNILISYYILLSVKR